MYHSFCCSLQLYIDATEVLKGQEKLEKTSFVPRFDRCSCLPAEKIIHSVFLSSVLLLFVSLFAHLHPPSDLKTNCSPWKGGTICPLAKELSVN